MLGRALLERKLNKGYLLNFFYMFYCDLFLKKTVKCTLGVWYLPSWFFPLLYVSSFLIQLNNNKYTFMKKKIFIFLFDSKRRLLHKISREVKGVFSGKKINKQLPQKNSCLTIFLVRKKKHFTPDYRLLIIHL